MTSARQGFAVDHSFLGQSRQLIRECVERTWSLFEEGQRLVQLVSPPTRPIVWLFSAGGRHVLRQIEMWNYETVLHRPRLSRAAKLWLVARAHVKAIMGGFKQGAAA
jgi:phytoene/squalene synthetase